MGFFNRIRPDSGIVSPVLSNPILVLSARSDPIRSGPVRSIRVLSTTDFKVSFFAKEDFLSTIYLYEAHRPSNDTCLL